MTRSKTLANLIDITESGTISILSFLLSYEISRRENVGKCKSTKVVFSEVFDINNFLIGLIAFSSKITLQHT